MCGNTKQTAKMGLEMQWIGTYWGKCKSDYRINNEDSNKDERQNESERT